MGRKLDGVMTMFKDVADAWHGSKAKAAEAGRKEFSEERASHQAHLLCRTSVYYVSILHGNTSA